MRIARLDVSRYGAFTDFSLDFPPAASDFHVVYGPNEAGKSTLRQALLDLLYGIHGRSEYGFKHGLSEMLLGGVLDDGAALPFAFQRFKRNKNPLVDAAGGFFTESDLARRLGGTDREFFERMFGLDHPSLVAGAKEILNSAGDVGQMLFQAAAGVSSLHRTREALEQEAHALWGERKRREAVYYGALERYDSAAGRLREVGVSAHKWLAAKRALDDAAAAAQRALDDYNRHLGRGKQLERVRRVAVPLQQLREAQAARAALGSPAPLPDDAAATFRAAQEAIAMALDRQRIHAQSKQDHEAALAAIVLRPALIEHKPGIDDLGGRVAKYLDARADLPRVLRDIDARTTAVRRYAADLGWPEMDVDAIAARLPTVLVREDIRASVRAEEKLTGAAQRALRDRDARLAALAELDRQLGEAPATDARPELDRALNAARVLNIATAAPAARRNAVAAKGALDAALTALAPWNGTLTDLRSLALPNTAEITRFTARRGMLEERASHAAKALQAKQLAAAGARVEAEEFVRRHDPVTHDVLTTGRASRDTLWQAIRAGAKSTATDGDAYEHEVRAADQLADRRYEGVAVVEQAYALDTRRRQCDAEAALLQAQQDAAAGELAAHVDGWLQRSTALGLAFLSADQCPAWSRLREAALLAADASVAAIAELDALTAEAAGVTGDLRAALQQAGVAGIDAADLPALVVRAEQLAAEQGEIRGQVKNWRKQRGEAAVALPLLDREVATTAAAVQAWSAARAALLASAGLPAELGAASVERALAIFADIDEACRLIGQEYAPRTRSMQGEIERFEQDAGALAVGCAADPAGMTATDIAARLKSLLQDAEAAKTEHDRLKAALAKAAGDVAATVAQQGQARAKMEPLLAAAKVDSIDALNAAIVHADACRSAELRVREALQAAGNNGDGLPLARLEAEVAAEDLTQIAARLEETEHALALAQAKRDEAVATRSHAEAAFGAIAGQDDAVRAEAERQDALLVMGEAVDEYVRITLGAKLLAWAVNRYSEEKQEPLLLSASGLFSTLTLGAYSKLSVAYDGNDRPVLHAYRPDGSFVAVGGLSTGTEDQLFLALRLAALLQHLQSATPLPFLADDIFINWDHERTAAGLQTLAELARKTQVIVLTHDNQLVDIARQVTGGQMNLIELPRPA